MTRKITRGASKIILGLQDKLYLGNLNAERDWGHAKDYVRVMWMILQADQAEDWIIATGVTTTVRDFVKMAFACCGIEIEFTGEGSDEVGIVKSVDKKLFSSLITNDESRITDFPGKEVVVVDPRYFRPTEVEQLIGDSSKARTRLGWEPEYDLKMLVEEMMASDLKLMQKDCYLKEGGYQIMSYFE